MEFVVCMAAIAATALGDSSKDYNLLFKGMGLVVFVLCDERELLPRNVRVCSL